MTSVRVKRRTEGKAEGRIEDLVITTAGCCKRDLEWVMEVVRTRLVGGLAAPGTIMERLEPEPNETLVHVAQ
jgi:hypothetical protein